jgi:ribosome maturation factor RimP
VAIPLPDLVDEVEARLERLGFELVEAGWVGSPRRPILRIRMDVPDSMPGKGGVTVDQCAYVSRELEPWLDGHPEVPERYVLEVSSPGVDRPLTRPRDWERFKGNPVLVKGRDLPGGRGNRLEGDLQGLERDEGGEAVVALLLEDGERVLIPLDRIQKAHLVYRWD